MPIRCPKCRKICKSQATYTKHYAARHYRKASKSKKSTIKTGKIPVWAKRRRS